MLLIYAKTRDQKRFYALDVHKGVQVMNLIFATMWKDEEREHVESLVRELEAQGKDVVFEIRRKA